MSLAKIGCNFKLFTNRLEDHFFDVFKLNENSSILPTKQGLVKSLLHKSISKNLTNPGSTRKRLAVQESFSKRHPGWTPLSTLASESSTATVNCFQFKLC